jgi:4-alpha-glucanotransferase
VLPLGSAGPGNSPYISPSAFAGNELLIDLCQLRDAGWLSDADLASVPAFPEGRIDYGAVRRFRVAHLRRAAKRFFGRKPAAERTAFEAFCTDEHAWLDDYALFMALDIAHGGDGRMWQDWPAALAHRQPAALREAQARHAEEIRFWQFCQWRFYEQWGALKTYARSRSIEIVGDLPIFVAAHSADVWSNPGLFELDKQGRPRVVAGVPPDYFSATGQRWGNPLYRWSAHAAEGYRWWVERMRQTMRLCDIVRIDHFRGFESFWEIPAESATAVDGQWRPGPGKDVFTAMRRELGDAQGRLRIIAEDLGIITPEVDALRQAIGLPGMRILQFAFDGDARNPYLPHNYDANTVVYTGTHDNDTSRGWWESDLDEAQKAKLGVLADKLREQRNALVGNTSDPRAEMASLVAGPTFDRAKAKSLVEAKTGAITSKSPEVIAAMADFYDSLKPEQQAKVREFMAKRGHRGWRG